MVFPTDPAWWRGLRDAVRAVLTAPAGPQSAAEVEATLDALFESDATQDPRVPDARLLELLNNEVGAIEDPELREAVKKAALDKLKA